MKSSSNTRPAVLLSLGNGKWHYNFNIQEVTEDGVTVYQYEAVEVIGKPSYASLVDARVRDIVSAEAEFSMINKYNDFNAGLSENTEDRDNYLAYRRQVLAIKAEVKQLFS